MKRKLIGWIILIVAFLLFECLAASVMARGGEQTFYEAFKLVMSLSISTGIVIAFMIIGIRLITHDEN